MGMVACFTSLAPRELQQLRDNPDEIEGFLYPDDGDSEPPNYLDLDKAWHGMHYLLTGEAYDGPPPLAPSMASVLAGVSVAVLPLERVSAALDLPQTFGDRQAAAAAITNRSSLLR